jgi:transposase, IS30 family
MPQCQLTLREREIIACKHHSGESVEKIAIHLGRHRTTVSRELLRNRDSSGEYLPAGAHQQAFERRSAIRHGHDKISENTELRSYLQDRLGEKYWSPDILAGRLRRDHPDEPSMRICTQTIYSWIRRDQGDGGRLHRCLSHGRRGYRKRGSGKELRGGIRNRVGIEERPEIVDKLGRFGDWESDTIVGKAHKGFIASHVERLSKYTVLALLADKRATTFNSGTLRAFRRHQRQHYLPLHTLTADNGTEFAGHEMLSEHLKADVYFAHPYSPWERGRNENMNRMVRQWFPKGLDFRSIHELDVQSVEQLLNNRPRKSLGYRTPKEVLLNLKI